MQDKLDNLSFDKKKKKLHNFTKSLCFHFVLQIVIVAYLCLKRTCSLRSDLMSYGIKFQGVGTTELKGAEGILLYFFFLFLREFEWQIHNSEHPQPQIVSQKKQRELETIKKE